MFTGALHLRSVEHETFENTCGFAIFAFSELLKPAVFYEVFCARLLKTHILLLLSFMSSNSFSHAFFRVGPLKTLAFILRLALGVWGAEGAPPEGGAKRRPHESVAKRCPPEKR